jgi:hypothetical protein
LLSASSEAVFFGAGDVSGIAAAEFCAFVVVALSVVCAGASALLEAAAFESGIVVAVVAPFAAVFAAAPLVLALATSRCLVLALLGAFASVFAGIFSGADVLAWSQAANGASSLSWLSVDGCKRGGEASETAAALSDTILGILGTDATPGSDISSCLPATGGPPRRLRQLL